jgi:hypothetical protein
MKKRNLKYFIVRISIISLLFIQYVFAQGYDDPLTIQGVGHSTLQSAASRAAGGTTIGIQNDVGLMFQNPASLQSLTGIQISIGGLYQNYKTSQDQNYAPLKYYSNFSLLMEGLTGYISNPDTSFHGSDPGDTVQRPFDKIGPNWSRSGSKATPVQALLAVPFSIGQAKFTIGLGAVEYANLNNYYQNNNVLSPTIGSERPIPTPLPGSNDSLPVQWYQYIRDRSGHITGYGIALSGSVTEKISLGVSGMILRGRAEDYESHVGRGRLMFFSNYFRLDSVYNRVTKTGISDFTGNELTFSGIYRGRYVSLGFSVKPPTTITRTYTTQTIVDTTGYTLSSSVSDQDEVKLPWRGTVGLSFKLLDNLSLGLEYEIRSLASTIYKSADGSKTNPWLSLSVLHIGAEYNPLSWLSVRAGVRGQAEVFQAEGSPIDGEPVSFSIYSAGCGFSFSGVRLNITYEYSAMKYQDMWQTNINLNNETRHGMVADLVFELPIIR